MIMPNGRNIMPIGRKTRPTGRKLGLAEKISTCYRRLFLLDQVRLGLLGRRYGLVKEKKSLLRGT